MRRIIVCFLLLTLQLSYAAELDDLYIEQQVSLEHLEQGFHDLLSHQPISALESLQKARSFLDKNDPSTPVIDFFISFGQAIAYDILGFQEQCRQALGSLMLYISAFNELGNADHAFHERQNDDNASDLEEDIHLLELLARLAPSIEIKQVLLSFVEEMAEEVLPPFKKASQLSCDIDDWEYDSDYHVSVYPCKSFWHKMKKFFKEAAEILKYVAAGLKSAHDIKNTCENWNRNKDENRNKNRAIHA